MAEKKNDKKPVISEDPGSCITIDSLQALSMIKLARKAESHAAYIESLKTEGLHFDPDKVAYSPSEIKDKYSPDTNSRIDPRASENAPWYVKEKAVPEGLDEVNTAVLSIKSDRAFDLIRSYSEKDMAEIEKELGGNSSMSNEQSTRRPSGTSTQSKTQKRGLAPLTDADLILIPKLGGTSTPPKTQKQGKGIRVPSSIGKTFSESRQGASAEFKTSQSDHNGNDVVGYRSDHSRSAVIKIRFDDMSPETRERVKKDLSEFQTRIKAIADVFNDPDNYVKAASSSSVSIDSCKSMLEPSRRPADVIAEYRFNIEGSTTMAELSSKRDKNFDLSEVRRAIGRDTEAATVRVDKVLEEMQAYVDEINARKNPGAVEVDFADNDHETPQGVEY